MGAGPRRQRQRSNDKGKRSHLNGDRSLDGVESSQLDTLIEDEDQMALMFEIQRRAELTSGTNDMSVILQQMDETMEAKEKVGLSILISLG